MKYVNPKLLETLENDMLSQRDKVQSHIDGILMACQAANMTEAFIGQIRGHIEGLIETYTQPAEESINNGCAPSPPEKVEESTEIEILASPNVKIDGEEYAPLAQIDKVLKRLGEENAWLRSVVDRSLDR